MCDSPDRDCPDDLREETAASAQEPRRQLQETAGKYHNVGSIQSHLSENQGEVALVTALRPDTKFYGDAYDRNGLLGCHGKTIL